MGSSNLRVRAADQNPIRMDVRVRPEPLSESLCVTMCATWTDLGTSSERIPSCICPFNG